MTLASIFLLLAAYVLVISNQQLHNPKLLGRRPYWWQTTDRQSPHYPAKNNNGTVVLFNNDQSVNQHPNYNPFQNDIAVSFHQFKPGKPSLIQNDGIHPSSAMDHQNEFVELFPDSQLRTNGSSRYTDRIL
ncbi:hypothetical protein DAPPUDRAFT_101109 [Daphnia pulex]|uniref:Uncharacterized protein n=1 Tax=Daphnia pulex TaxID=6669 RepID=E9GCD7_DAPPU|nr:hypothetical protein DAPPUDRAFT_101109 [Daphnia pulex]|eukprot:EFX82873.1 hypothetical protein DAPPUDRAFT_101109 [Daphnia pulex]